MPRATITTESVHYDLKTLEDGFVELRRMSYDKWLSRQEMALRMQFEGKKGGSVAGEMAMANKAVTQFEFRECIVDHNLEDENGNHLDFRSPAALAMLDPRIGNEIGQYIMELHEFDASGNSEP